MLIDCINEKMVSMAKLVGISLGDVCAAVRCNGGKAQNKYVNDCGGGAVGGKQNQELRELLFLPFEELRLETGEVYFLFLYYEGT